MSVLTLHAAEMATPVADGSPSRAANFAANELMATPNQNAMPHVRFKVAREDGEQPQTVTDQIQGVCMRRGTERTARQCCQLQQSHQKSMSTVCYGAGGFSFVAQDTKT